VDTVLGGQGGLFDTCFVAYGACLPDLKVPSGAVVPTNIFSDSDPQFVRGSERVPVVIVVLQDRPKASAVAWSKH
jgi:hypothetical protein